MGAVALWISLAVACVMMLWRKSRNSAYFALAGTALGALYHYDIATVPETRGFAMLLWAASLSLLAAKMFPARRRRSA